LTLRLDLKKNASMSSRLVIFLAAFLAFLPGVGAAELSSEEIKSAEKLYQAKCAKCHKFYNPSDYTGPEWQKWMLKMKKKSKLKPDQYELLSRYLDTFRRPSNK